MKETDETLQNYKDQYHDAKQTARLKLPRQNIYTRRHIELRLQNHFTLVGEIGQNVPDNDLRVSYRHCGIKKKQSLPL